MNDSVMPKVHTEGPDFRKPITIIHSCFSRPGKQKGEGCTVIFDGKMGLINHLTLSETNRATNEVKSEEIDK